MRAALRSDAPLVAVEAPAGCGKTTQGAEYARELAAAGSSSRLLILTHTHAACSVFSDRTKGVGARIEIRTIDGVIARIASVYHVGLGLPADTAAWVRQRRDGHADLALKVAALLKRYPMIAAAMAQRHPVVICDERRIRVVINIRSLWLFTNRAQDSECSRTLCRKYSKTGLPLAPAHPATGTLLQGELSLLNCSIRPIGGPLDARHSDNGLSRLAPH